MLLRQSRMAEKPRRPGQRQDALVEQQRRQSESMERIATAIEVMVNTTMTVALVYPWKNDPSVVRAVLVRNEHERQRLRLSVREFAGSNRAMAVEEWLRKDGFVVLNNEQLFVDGNGIGMFAPRAIAAHRELIPPNELDPAHVTRQFSPNRFSSTSYPSRCIPPTTAPIPRQLSSHVASA